MKNKITAKDIVACAKEVHGDRFDYSLTEYINADTKIKIICREHGVFEKLAGNHINLKQGCQKCSGRKRDINDFIRDAKAIHGDRYDYSRSKYIGAESTIEVICKKHGSFYPYVHNHLRGHDCPKCRGKYKTSKEIIKDFKKVHGNRYDYSKVEYIKREDKVDIICKKHGIFPQSSNAHLRGVGCPKCALDNKFKTTEHFIEKATAVHGERYDYSLVEYIRYSKKVKIICKDHGIFEQTPVNHINHKQNCPKCAISDTRVKEAKFIAAAIKKYGSQYDYSEVKYIHINTNVKIKCKDHGIFEMTPNNHLHKGKFCSECTKNKSRNKKLKCFIASAKKIHGDRYDYSKVEYIDAKTKVKIRCKEHGIFEKKIGAHINGKQGCPKCSKENK